MLYAIVAVISLILDQAVKYWTTVKIVVDTGRKTLIPGVIRLTNVHNTGAAFSFLSGKDWARWLFVLLCLAFTALVIYVLAKRIINTPGARWAAVIVLAGALGNCIDRVVCGYVVDMLELEFITFPVFNIADIYITLGAIAFCICVLVEKDPAKTAKAPAVEAASGEAGTPKAGKKRRRRHHTKLDIPTFPKREAVEQPPIDPNDPFAEWEKGDSQAKTQDVQPEQGPGGVVYTRPAAERPNISRPAQEQPRPDGDRPRIVEINAAKLNQAKAPAPPAKSAAPKAPMKPAAPAATANPAQGAGDEDSFDLDDILAEFRDL